MPNGVITEIGRKKLCKAHAGDITLPKITQMAFGSGGVNTSGEVIAPTGAETALKKEILKKNIDGHMYTNEKETSCRYTARLEKEELANQSISEQGLFDEDGDLVAYITFLPKGKDEGMVFIFDMDEIF